MKSPGVDVSAVVVRPNGSSRVRNILLAVCAALAMTGVVGAVSADGATRLVSTSGANSGNCTSSACATVQYAINQAVADDTISIGSGSFSTAAAISVNKKLTIAGSGVANTTITNSAGGSQVFSLVTGSTGTEIKDLKVSGSGSGIYTNAASGADNIKLTDVEVTGATSYGVAIHNNAVISGWQLLRVNSHNNNTGMRIRGSATNMTITDSHFDDNAADGFNVTTANPAPNVSGISLVNTTANRNFNKGIYVESGSNFTLNGVTCNGGVRRETILFLEKGKYNPSLKLAYDIAKILGAQIEEIFIFEDE